MARIGLLRSRSMSGSCEMYLDRSTPVPFMGPRLRTQRNVKYIYIFYLGLRSSHHCLMDPSPSPSPGTQYTCLAPRNPNPSQKPLTTDSPVSQPSLSCSVSSPFHATSHTAPLPICPPPLPPCLNSPTLTLKSPISNAYPILALSICRCCHSGPNFETMSCTNSSLDGPAAMETMVAGSPLAASAFILDEAGVPALV